jgi:hypothetical protein
MDTPGRIALDIDGLALVRPHGIEDSATATAYHLSHRFSAQSMYFMKSQKPNIAASGVRSAMAQRNAVKKAITATGVILSP